MRGATTLRETEICCEHQHVNRGFPVFEKTLKIQSPPQPPPVWSLSFDPPLDDGLLLFCSGHEENGGDGKASGGDAGAANDRSEPHVMGCFFLKVPSLCSSFHTPTSSPVFMAIVNC